MALTSTATNEMHQEVVIYNHQITKGTYSGYMTLQARCNTVWFYPTKLFQTLLIQGFNYPKSIIYCRYMNDCSDLYLLFREALKKKFTVLYGALNISNFIIVNIFTSCIDHDIKETSSLNNKIHAFWLLLRNSGWAYTVPISGKLCILDLQIIWKVMFRRLNRPMEMASVVWPRLGMVDTRLSMTSNC